MGAGAGVKFDVTLGHPDSFDLKAKGPDWIKKADLGVKIGKKKEFTDCVVVPIERVKLESAYSGATVRSYDGEPPIGYLLIDAKSINEAISEEIQDFKERYYSPGAKLTEFTLEVNGVVPEMYSGGWVRSRFPADGMLDADTVEITVSFAVNGRKDHVDFSVEGTLYFPDHDGYIPFERWMYQEYNQITVRQAYTDLDDLWAEDEPEPEDEDE